MPITTPAQLDLAYRVSERLHDHPEQHDQAIYYREDVCGTAGCIAGWTAVLDGARPVFAPLGSRLALEVTTADGEDRDIAEYAQQALGLDVDEARELFRADQAGWEAREYLDELIEDAVRSGVVAASGGAR